MGFAPEGAAAGTCAATDRGATASASATPAASTAPLCTKARRSRLIVISCLHPGLQESSSGQWGDLDRVEVGHAVRLGPERDLAGIGEGLVGGSEQDFAVERDG